MKARLRSQGLLVNLAQCPADAVPYLVQTTLVAKVDDLQLFQEAPVLVDDIGKYPIRSQLLLAHSFGVSGLHRVQYLSQQEGPEWWSVYVEPDAWGGHNPQ